MAAILALRIGHVYNMKRDHWEQNVPHSMACDDLTYRRACGSPLLHTLTLEAQRRLEVFPWCRCLGCRFLLARGGARPGCQNLNAVHTL
ncbi:unnamed protein product [Merluccius merluccius]